MSPIRACHAKMSHHAAVIHSLRAYNDWQLANARTTGGSPVIFKFPKIHLRRLRYCNKRSSEPRVGWGTRAHLYQLNLRLPQPLLGFFDVGFELPEGGLLGGRGWVSWVPVFKAQATLLMRRHHRELSWEERMAGANVWLLAHVTAWLSQVPASAKRAPPARCRAASPRAYRAPHPPPSAA